MRINAAGINTVPINNGLLALVSVEVEPLGVVRYECILTGAPDGTTDLELPISSFNGFLRDGDPTQLYVVISAVEDLVIPINDRQNGELVVTRKIIDTFSGNELDSQELVRVDLESIRFDQGSRNYSATLGGSRSIATGTPKLVVLEGVSYMPIFDGVSRARARMNSSVRPGDTVNANGVEFIVSTINYFVGPTDSQMEVQEREEV